MVGTGRALEAAPDDPPSEARAALARFMAETLLPETGSLKARILRGALSLAAAQSSLL